METAVGPENKAQRLHTQEQQLLPQWRHLCCCHRTQTSPTAPLLATPHHCCPWKLAAATHPCQKMNSFCTVPACPLYFKFELLLLHVWLVEPTSQACTLAPKEVGKWAFWLEYWEGGTHHVGSSPSMGGRSKGLASRDSPPWWIWVFKFCFAPENTAKDITTVDLTIAQHYCQPGTYQEKSRKCRRSEI